jgi:hypothetical protein
MCTLPYLPMLMAGGHWGQGGLEGGVGRPALGWGGGAGVKTRNRVRQEGKCILLPENALFTWKQHKHAS